MIEPSQAVVTTPRRPKAVDVAEARAEAARLGCRYVERRSQGWEKLVETTGARAVLAVAHGDRALWLPGMTVPWRFHGGMAVLRIRRMIAGVEPDPFLAACDVRAGDRFLDCTGGACADALVAAHAVGEGGHVEVIEASALLHAVTGHGARHVRFGEAPIDAALSRMHVTLGDHLEVLRSLPDRSYDVVYFDPMFRETTTAAPGFDVVRALADPRPLAAEALAEARRVARRRVVLQDRKTGGELERLGLPELPVMSRYAQVRFGGLVFA
ncbi:class I SAM-dependent methyltransferase [Vulgatibacter sp.]|uniref:class I SAM-dependent methyltransferase n=1 Tax=Vulgatibacter sp. TaxID=1971226 RepID=UPI003564B4F4